MITIRNLVRDMELFKILIVDDEARVRRALRKAMREIGFNNFRECGSGEEALERLKGEDFDFVICGWRMSGINGLVVLLTVRRGERNAAVPFLMIVSDAESRRLDELLGPEEDGYITRPFTPRELENRMFEILFNKMPPAPEDPHLQAAGRHLADGEFTKAHLELDRAIGVAPRNPLIGYFRHLVFEAEGRPEKAEEAAGLARRLFKSKVLGPKKAKQHVLQGQALLREGHVEEAQRAFAKAMKNDPDNPERKIDIGEAFLAHGRADEAEAVFEDYVRSAPGSVFVYNRLGMVYRKMKKFDRAVAYYMKALEMDPDEEYVHFNLARAYLRSGRTNQAQDSLNTALRLQPDFLEARQLLSAISSS